MKEITGPVDASRNGPMVTTSASARIWRHFDPSEQARICRICGAEKPLQQFDKTSPYNGHVYRRRVGRECRRPSQRTLQKRWNEAHRDKRVEIWRNNNLRRFLRNKGIPERKFQEVVEREFKDAYPLHKLHPDYYHSGRFVEVKRASTKKEYLWRDNQRSFPQLILQEWQEKCG